MSFTYTYPRPAVTVDCVVLFRNDSTIRVLLIKRKHPPFENHWAFPGGFVDMDEGLEAAAARELEEETGLSGLKLKQFHTYGDPLRDPRHRTITVVYTSFTDNELLPKAGDDAVEVQWFDCEHLPALAFDHQKIITAVLNHFSTDKKT